ncbi:MAG TPA: SRPBCC domain-containing protein [Rugosimonospora sp.]
MIPNVIEQEILIEAPMDVVWRVVTEPEQISRWFSDSAEIDMRPGGDGVLAWKDHGTVKLRVEKLEPPRAFSFRWVFPEGAEPREGNSMLVEFALSAEGESTRLRVVERGMRDMGAWTEEEKARFVEDHTAGWVGHLGGLRTYVAQDCQVSMRP